MARRIVESASRRLKARFMFVMKRMECKVRTVKRTIRVGCVVHICEALNTPQNGGCKKHISLMPCTHNLCIIQMTTAVVDV